MNTVKGSVFLPGLESRSHFRRDPTRGNAGRRLCKAGWRGGGGCWPCVFCLSGGLLSAGLQTEHSAIFVLRAMLLFLPGFKCLSTSFIRNT